MATRRRLLIMGAPGSGKGTQAELVARRRSLAHISTGEMLRAAMAAGTVLGRRVKEVVERGDLVDDALMLEMVEARLSEPDARKGFLLDGFPRTVPQAESLLRVLGKDGRTLDMVLVLSVSDAEILKRNLARGRADDTEQTIRYRLEVYRKQTEPVLAYLRAEVPVAEVDGTGAVEEIAGRIDRVLDAAHPA